MGRKKTGIRRIRKKDLRRDIEEMFQQNPTTAYEQRTICRNFSLTTPPARQLVADILQRAESPSLWLSATRCAPWRATGCASA